MGDDATLVMALPDRSAPDGSTLTASDEYAAVFLADDSVLVYDPDDATGWVQSDSAVSLHEIR